MTVTRLTADPRRPGSVVVHLDGARFASLPVETVQALGLSQGMELDAKLHERLRRAAASEGAYRQGVKLLAVRGRSVFELQRRLRQKHGPDAAAEAVGRLEVQGLLNDGAFARAFALSRSGRGHGRSRILADLSRLGVERRVAEEAVAEMGDGEAGERDRLERLARKRAAQLEGLAPDVRFRRLVGFLSRRGYGGRDVIDVARKVLARSNES